MPGRTENSDSVPLRAMSLRACPSCIRSQGRAGLKDFMDAVRLYGACERPGRWEKGKHNVGGVPP